jgi:hypothetical protein
MSDTFKSDPAPNSFGRSDPRVIELDNPHERAYWCKFLQVDEAELEVAVAAAGNSVQKVKEWLARRS